MTEVTKSDSGIFAPPSFMRPIEPAFPPGVYARCLHTTTIPLALDPAHCIWCLLPRGHAGSHRGQVCEGGTVGILGWPADDKPKSAESIIYDELWDLIDDLLPEQEIKRGDHAADIATAIVARFQLVRRHDE